MIGGPCGTPEVKFFFLFAFRRCQGFLDTKAGWPFSGVLAKLARLDYTIALLDDDGLMKMV